MIFILSGAKLQDACWLDVIDCMESIFIAIYFLSNEPFSSLSTPSWVFQFFWNLYCILPLDSKESSYYVKPCRCHLARQCFVYHHLFSLHFIAIFSAYTFVNLYKTPNFPFLQALFSHSVSWPHYHELHIPLRFHQPSQDCLICQAVLNSRVRKWFDLSNPSLHEFFPCVFQVRCEPGAKISITGRKMEICRQIHGINMSMFTSSSETFELQGVKALSTEHLYQKPGCLQSNGAWRYKRWVYRSHVSPCAR